MRLSPLALVLATLAGCGLSEFIAPGPAPVTTAGWHVGIETTGERTVLAIRRRTAAGEAVATTSGVRLVLGDGVAHELAFTGHEVDGDTLRLRCASEVPDHAVTVVVTQADDRLRVAVQDAIELPSELAELSLEYLLVARGDGNVFETFAPQGHSSPREVAGDVTWRTPIAFARGGDEALGLLPDVTTTRPRLLPGALEVSVDATGARVRHGLVAQRLVRTGDSVTCLRDPAQARRVAGQPVGFAHEVRLWPDAQPLHTVTNLAHELWQELAVGPAAHVPFALAPQVDRLLGARPRAGSTGDMVVPFTPRANGLLLAAALATRDDPEAQADARRLVQLALSAPQRAGLSPDRAQVVAGRATWTQGPVIAPGTGTPDAIYDATAVAWTRVCGLRATRHLAADDRDRQAAERAALATARFLMANQRPSGAVPALFDAHYLAPIQHALFEPAAEAGAAALLFAECARLDCPEAAALRAAALATVLYLQREVWPERAWHDRATLGAGTRGGGRGTLGLTFAALAAVRLAATVDHAGLRAAVVAFFDELALQQQVWSPMWISLDPGHPRLIGGFGRHDADPEWSDAGQALAALAFLHGYDHLGRRDLLQRGACALRAALASAPAHPDDRLDALSPLGMAAAVAQLAFARWGSVVVDARGEFAEALGAVQASVLGVADDEIALLVRSPEALAARTTAVVRGLDPSPARRYVLVVNNQPGPPRTAEELAAGVAIAPLCVPTLTLTPPARIQADLPFRPSIRFAEPPPSGFSGSVTLHGQAPPWTCALAPTDDPRTWQTTIGFLAPRDLPRDSELQAHAQLVGPDGQRVVAIADQAIAVSTETAIDIAGLDDTDCRTADVCARVWFADGSRLARAAGDGDRALVWQLRLPSAAQGLDLDILLAGRLRLHANDSVVHEDPVDVTTGPRRLRVKITDRRLWEAATLALRFTDLAPGARQPLQVAELCTRVVVDVGTPSEPATEPFEMLSRPDRGLPPDPQIAVLVLPAPSADAPLTLSRDQLTALFFGDNYRRTPEPKAQATSGSVREILLSISGGRTNLVGEVADPVQAPWSAADLGGAGSAELLVAMAERALAEVRGPFDVVLVVHSGRVADGADHGELLLRRPGRPPIVTVAEHTEPDSLLPVGSPLAALLSARYGLARRSLPATGNFGALALTGHVTDHLPAAPIGVDLAAAGWADVVDVIGTGGEITAAATQRERRIYRLASDLPGRGDLFLEVRGGVPEEPSLPESGLFGYWRLPHPPLVRGSQGLIEHPTVLRLARVVGVVDSPFVPGTAADLVRRSPRLDDFSAPSLATPDGELCYVLRNVGPTPTIGDNDLAERIGFTVEKLSRRLLAQVPTAEARVAATPEWRQLSLDGIERGIGAMSWRANALTFAPRALPLRATWPAQRQPYRGYRVFGHGRLERGRVRLRIGHGDTVGLDTIFADPQAEVALTVDLPPTAADDTRWWIEAAALDGDGAVLVLDDLVVVPRARADHAPLRSLKTATARLSDGRVHAPLLALTTGADSRSSIHEPVLIPAQRAMLRLRCGLAADAPAETAASIDVVLSSVDGKVTHRLLQGEKLVRGTGPQPILTALLAIPAATALYVGVLHITVRAAPGTTVWIANVEVARP